MGHRASFELQKLRDRPHNRLKKEKLTWATCGINNIEDSQDSSLIHTVTVTQQSRVAKAGGRNVVLAEERWGACPQLVISEAQAAWGVRTQTARWK